MWITPTIVLYYWSFIYKVGTILNQIFEHFKLTFLVGTQYNLITCT